MFSGKTSTLKKIYDQCMYCNIPVIVINYEADNRYCDASFMSTHDKVMIPCIKGLSILEILSFKPPHHLLSFTGFVWKL